MSEFSVVILVNIFDFLDKYSLYNCSLVCKKWSRSVNHKKQFWFPLVFRIIEKEISLESLVTLLLNCNREKLENSRFKCLLKLLEREEDQAS